MANTGQSAFGERGISGIFGWDNNEIHRKVYLSDPKNQFIPLLNELFGTGTNLYPLPFPSPFSTFRAFSVSFETQDKGAQKDTSSEGDFSLLNNFPTIRGGIVVDITYRPLDAQGYKYVEDEGWDFSAQVMSLIGNNYGTNPSALYWSNGDAITNLSTIIKIIPKIEFIQKQIYCTTLPTQTQMNLIGAVNAGPMVLGASGTGNTLVWPEGTVLLTGMPAIRRWRFDGLQVFEIGVKIAINVYQDVTESSGSAKDYVTWNRLYRPGNGTTRKGIWDKVFIGPVTDGNTLYPEADLGQITGEL